MAHIVGSRACFLLLNRSVLSVLDTVFDLIKAGRPSRAVPTAARRELRLLVALAPDLTVNMQTLIGTITLVSDASSAGQRGVVRP